MKNRFHPLRWFLRLMAVMLLVIVALMMIFRTDFSGWIAYVSDQDGKAGIYIMSGDGGARQKITPTRFCPSHPHWSPDGKWIAFLDACTKRDQLLRVRPGSRILRFVAEAALFEWSPDSEHVLVQSPGDFSPYIVKANQSEVQLPLLSYHNPQWSPDGEWIYYWTPSNDLNRINIDTNHIERIVSQPGSALSWSPDHTQFVLVLQGQLVRVAADGSTVQPISFEGQPANIANPLWSPDGKWIAFISGVQYGWHIYRVRPDGTDFQRVSQRATSVDDLQWSPDSQWLLFAATYRSYGDIIRIRADGSRIENLAHGSSPQVAPVGDRKWYPLWLMITAAVMIFVSILWKVKL